MANIGLKNALYNKIDYSTSKYASLTGSNVPVLGKTIDAKFEKEKNDTSLFADDVVAEHDDSFKSGTLSLTIDNVDSANYSALSGSVITTDEVVENVDDTTPEIGYGHIVTKMVNGVKQYKVEFLPRVRITKISEELKTKGESIEFGTVSIEGKVLALSKAINGLAVGDYRKFKTFTTYDAALTYLKGLLTPVA